MLIKPGTCKNCPLYEYPHGSKVGFSRLDGTGKSGVLVIGEALGEAEEEAGVPFVGKSGYYLFNALSRVGIERDDLMLFNTIACRPPKNKLVGMQWEQTAIEHCTPNLDAAIAKAREVAKGKGKTFTILTLGKTAFKRIMGYTDRHPIMRSNYLCYPFWNEQYGAWVIAADHPSYLMRGKHSLLPILQFAFKRAIEIADKGLILAKPTYLLDPQPAQFAQWVNDYFYTLERDPFNTYLSYDIETPMKQGRDEEEVAKEDDDDYTILRCSFSYKPGHAVSIPWRAEYIPSLEAIFGADGAKVGWNNEHYDYPRVKAKIPIIRGDQLDAMLAWHVLNSAMPKGLGFVTPFYVHDSLMWKYLSEAEPAFYNAKDADMALQNFLGIKKDLEENHLWGVFDRHIIQLNRVFAYMSGKGVHLDMNARNEAETKLTEIQADIEDKIDKVIPLDARQLKVYKKTPANTEGMLKVKGTVKSKKCPKCGELSVKADHFKSIGKKKLKNGEEENPCAGLKSEPTVVSSWLYAQAQPFKISIKSLKRYQESVGHKPIIDPKKKTVTFDEKAIMRLMKAHKDDALYPLVLEFRGVQKLLGTYVGITQENGKIKGGMPVETDGCIHTLFTHNPSTLRSASQNPNLQNLPRPRGEDDLATIIRKLIVPSKGNILLARDYSGIEAVLVGYFANSKDYIRLSKKDVHSFYTAYALHELDPKRISANDLPLLSWPDDRLFKRLSEIKKEFKEDRNSLYKHLVHGANFFQGARGAAEKIFAETGVEFETKLVSKVMGIYFELFPDIRRWHKTVLAQADRDGFLRNPFGYVHRFSKIYDWEKVGGQWQKEPGAEANKVIAFGPQSTAAGIIKEAMMRLFFTRFEEAGQFLRLLIHDELFCDVPESLVEAVDEVMLEEMEKPIPELPLPESFGMGPFLSIATEAKRGYRWGDMF